MMVETPAENLLGQVLAQPHVVSVGMFLYKHRVPGGASARVTVRRTRGARFVQYVAPTLGEALQQALDGETDGLATGTEG